MSQKDKEPRKHLLFEHEIFSGVTAVQELYFECPH